MTRYRIPTTDPRLGRCIDHDVRSLRYLAPEAGPTAVSWERHIPILDQGQLGSCTGNATVGALGTGPLWDALPVTDDALLTEDLAVSIYSAAEILDGGAGLPSEDNGSSGLSVAKVAKSRGYVSGYVHATSIAQAHGALQQGPIMLGTDWMSSFDSPNAQGVVTYGGTVRGGHEYLCRGYDPTTDLWHMDNSWGTSWGQAGSFYYDTPTLTRLLANGGDVTALVPLSQPAPVPTPPSPTPSGTSRTWADPMYVAGLDAWAALRHVGSNAKAAAAWKRGQASMARSTVVNMTITAAPGMDEHAIAAIAARRLRGLAY